MSYKQVYEVQYISPYLSEAVMNYENIITEFKKKMVCDLLEIYPSMEYRDIRFEVLKPEPSELYRWVEDFKCLDGRYHYCGDCVSREWLEKELSQKDYKIFMNANVEGGANEH